MVLQTSVVKKRSRKALTKQQPQQPQQRQENGEEEEKSPSQEAVGRLPDVDEERSDYGEPGRSSTEEKTPPPGSRGLAHNSSGFASFR